jgi:hypothetical protein
MPGLGQDFSSGEEFAAHFGQLISAANASFSRAPVAIMRPPFVKIDS